MGDAPPKWNTDPIETWLPGGYDIYAIAAQECSYSPRHGYNSCEDDFYGWIGNHLGDDFLKLACSFSPSSSFFPFVDQERDYD